MRFEFGKAMGIRNVFSSWAQATHPVVNNEPIPFDVWLSPTIPEWDYVPMQNDGPFRLLRCEADSYAVYGYAEAPDLPPIIETFARFHLPRRRELCLILDIHSNIVLGWLWDDDESNFRWMGSQIAFGLLACHKPVDAAIWESAASTVRSFNLGEVIPHER